MKIVPIRISDANEFIKKHHRHNKPTVGYVFCIGVEHNDKLVGVAVCGRPVSRHLDNKYTLEILRVCTDGTKNASSFLYSRCKRIGQLLGCEKIITYTLQSESGASLRAIGAKIEKVVEHNRDWNDSKKVKRVKDSISKEPKYKWRFM